MPEARQSRTQHFPHADAVMKLGGSLLDLPDLPQRFANYLADAKRARTLLVVGGGDAAEMVRRFDRVHQLDETAGHWLAVRGMAINALMLAEVLPRVGVTVRMVDRPEVCAAAWEGGALAMMEPMGWLTAAEAAGARIPHCWQFTSDSIAAHAAHQLGAPRLTLLKSTLPATETDAVTLNDASRAGVVDEELPRNAAGLPCVELVNLRAGRSARPSRSSDDGWPRCELKATS